MSDESVIEPFGVPEIFVDGFTHHTAHDGVMTCIGYRKMPSGKVVVLRLAWPAVNTAAAITDAEEAMKAIDLPPVRRERVPKRDIH